MEVKDRERAIRMGIRRCEIAIEKVERLEIGSKITQSCTRTLLKLLHSEHSFLSSSFSSHHHHHVPLSLNIGHLEAVIHILHKPFVTGVSRVCKTIPLSSSASETTANSTRVHVDIVCILNKNPVWVIVSDRNPKYISWLQTHKSTGLKSRIQQLLVSAKSSPFMKPTSIILFFSHGLCDTVLDKLHSEFGASDFRFEVDFCEELDGDWVNVFPNSYKNATVLQIAVEYTESNPALAAQVVVKDLVFDPAALALKEHIKVNVDDDTSFSSLISGIQLWIVKDLDVEFAKLMDLSGEYDLINFDTTALIALVSGISNGCAEKLLATPETEMRQRFKGNFEFVIAQVMSEIQNPIHGELAGVISGKRGIICESVHSEFKELISLCGGPNEKIRADAIMKRLMVVPDRPSERMMGLPTTRKLALKNKIVFGTGDRWHAPTLTANMAFVRAVSQTGMSLSTIQHRPRALTGD
ncbi:hypothetical protein K2173_013978 [Erythroxylum novogranatense]|uniref:DUF1308 domain-containing protein n=1 Tax=Erythroxylum novogranatense TaxID=1862640 RepID=A0AAV8SDE6_9ROSI|nr:hypothetical protein K2173_013978 [Erythroxylum novogranatense]